MRNKENPLMILSRYIKERDKKEKQNTAQKKYYSKNKLKYQQYYDDNSEKKKQLALEYYYNHKDEISSKYHNDPEKHFKVKTYNKKYYLLKTKFPKTEECIEEHKIDTSSYFEVKISEGKFIIEL